MFSRLTFNYWWQFSIFEKMSVRLFVIEKNWHPCRLLHRMLFQTRDREENYRQKETKIRGVWVMWESLDVFFLWKLLIAHFVDRRAKWKSVLVCQTNWIVIVRMCFLPDAWTRICNLLEAASSSFSSKNLLSLRVSFLLLYKYRISSLLFFLLFCWVAPFLLKD